MNESGTKRPNQRLSCSQAHQSEPRLVLLECFDSCPRPDRLFCADYSLWIIVCSSFLNLYWSVNVPARAGISFSIYPKTPWVIIDQKLIFLTDKFVQFFLGVLLSSYCYCVVLLARACSGRVFSPAELSSARWLSFLDWILDPGVSQNLAAISTRYSSSFLHCRKTWRQSSLN